MNSRWLFTTILSTAISFTAYAEEEFRNGGNAEIKIQDSLGSLNLIANAPSQQTQMNPKCGKDPYPSQDERGRMFKSAMPTLENSWGVIVFGEWLYWVPHAEGFQYGVQSEDFSGRPPFLETDILKGVHGKVSQVNPNYSTGYRFGLDIKMPHDNWDLYASWSQFQNHRHDAIEQKFRKVIWPSFLVNLNVPKALSAKAKWELEYSVLDVDLGRSFFVAKHLSIRPFFGFQAAWIEQEFTVKYLDVIFLGGATVPGIRSHNHNKFQGYGMRVGLDTKWPISWGFSLLGNFSTSLLFSKVDVSRFEKIIHGFPRTVLKDEIHNTLPVIEMMGGICWETQFFKNRCYFSLSAGWEEQVWFQQVQTSASVNTNGFGDANVGDSLDRAGNLTLSGWTVGAKFGF